MELLNLKYEDVTYVWIADNYDGRLAGLLLYKGKLCWYHCVDQSDHTQSPTWYRRFELFYLDEEESRLALEMRADFNKFVGCGYEELLSCSEDYDHPTKEDWPKFYSKYDRVKNFEYDNLIKYKKPFALLED